MRDLCAEKLFGEAIRRGWDPSGPGATQSRSAETLRTKNEDPDILILDTKIGEHAHSIIPTMWKSKSEIDLYEPKNVDATSLNLRAGGQRPQISQIGQERPRPQT